MAKRKRLTPARPEVFATETPEAAAAALPRPASPARAPIAQVAGDVAITAAFEEVQSELQTAQRERRMVLSLPLEAIREDHLIRDRITCDAEEMEALKQSLRSRGQQSPLEVVELGQGRYGLISGWRRLRALRELQAETGRPGTALALLRAPEDQPAAYVAMVEENEIRADLSFYERARIVVSAVRAGVFDSDKQALQTLFASASFSKRSKIKSFMPLVAELDAALSHPAQIPERLGLALSKALSEEPGFAARLLQGLRGGAPMSAEAERALLEQSLSRQDPALDAAPDAGPDAAAERPAAPARPAPAGRGARDLDLGPGLKMRAGPGAVTLKGDGITEELIERLAAWLKQQG